MNRTESHGPARATARLTLGCLCLLASVWTPSADAGSRIVATGGASTSEGSAGGGLVPWALLSGYGDDGEIGGAAFVSTVRVDDFSLSVVGASVSIDNRVEFSAAKQRFDIDSVVPGETLEQSILGVKFRLFGEVPYDRGAQVALGVQLKQSDTFEVPEAVGARDDSGVDVYLAASKLWLAGPFGRSLFLNGTLRATQANQSGLMGFGTAGDSGHELMAEAAGGVFLNRHWVVGAEYRQKPDRLDFAREDDWKDVFIGWFPNKRLSVVAAWTDLGSIAGLDDQRGVYLSVEIAR